MTDQVQAEQAYRVRLGAAWWVALTVVAVGAGLLGMGSRGFLSTALWSVVAFVVGSLVAIAVSAPGRPAAPAVAR